MNYLVDALTIFDFFKGKTELFDFFDDTENIYVSVVTAGELNYLARKETPETEKNVIQIAEDFVHLLHIVNIDESIAMEYGKLKQRYPDFNDNKLWLCATAVVRDLVIVSSDEGYSGIAEVVVKRF